MKHTCPTCKGEKDSLCHVNRGTDSATHTWEHLACFTCKGLGYVTETHLAAIRNGAEFRSARVARRETLRDCAIRLGLTPVQVSEHERGEKILATSVNQNTQ